jgi:GntR family transcriptional repressor for pyruvate dehydrogenase complex
MFNAVRLNKASMQIISQVRGMIFGGKLSPGDRLPPEAALLEQFQVSRQTLKEALRALEYMGLLEIRKGVTGGPYVVAVHREVMREVLANFLFFKDVTIRSLSEVRKLVEPHTTGIAAQRATAEDLDRLGALLEAARGAVPEATQHDVEFHRVIAAVAGNPILELVVDFVETALADLKRVIRPGADFSAAVLGAHGRILEALRRGDAAGAAEEMHGHLLQVEERLASLEAEAGAWKPMKWPGAATGQG